MASFFSVPELAYSYQEGFNYRQLLEERHHQDRQLDGISSIMNGEFSERLSEQNSDLADSISGMCVDISGSIGTLSEISALGFRMMRDEVRISTKKIQLSIFALEEAISEVSDGVQEIAEILRNSEAVWSYERPCCTNRLRDSLHESSMIAGSHEQLGPDEVQDHELVGL